jgi:hypothetical protein
MRACPIGTCVGGIHPVPVLPCEFPSPSGQRSGPIAPRRAFGCSTKRHGTLPRAGFGISQDAALAASRTSRACTTLTSHALAKPGQTAAGSRLLQLRPHLPSRRQRAIDPMSQVQRLHQPVRLRHHGTVEPSDPNRRQRGHPKIRRGFWHHPPMPRSPRAWRTCRVR